MADEYQLRKDIDRFNFFLNELTRDFEEFYGTSNLSFEKVFQEIDDISDSTLERALAILREEFKNCQYTNVSSDDLLEAIVQFQKSSEDKYTMFRGDCWTINSNFEASASITSTDIDNFKVTGTFRTSNDLIGIYWNSEDIITHKYISYGSKTDYTGVTLEFDYSMTGCTDFSNGVVSITINKLDGSVYYLTMGRFISNGHITIDFDNLTLLAGNGYIDSTGNWVIVSETTSLKVDDIKNIMFVLIPPQSVYDNTQYKIISNQDFTCTVSNINVTGGDICKEHLVLDSQPYRLCEGYDDFYNLNPYRVVREMRKLGYTDWVDLYIGASHFYEKSGTVGDVITNLGFNHNRTEKMVVDTSVPLNKAFAEWLDCYSSSLKANDVDNLVISVSMENLQCPASWRQKTSSGDYAVTGWTPSTFFYSPCNTEAITYMKSVSQTCLDIIVANGLNPILQLGEAWWWWNELDTPNQPPCFYDNATKDKYYSEFGENLPSYTSSWATDYDSDVMDWLNQQIVLYSEQLRSVVKSNRYTDGQYMALFFPPSVLDTERVPPMIQQVDYLTGIYNPSHLDILQLEDYDWVTDKSPHHDEVYELGQSLGFDRSHIHYFGGFVLNSEDAVEYWKLIKEAMLKSIDTGFAETFVWAGSQVRRDGKMLGYDTYEFVANNEIDMDLNEYIKKSRTEGFVLNDGSIDENKYALLNHNHDERYYTKAEIDAIISQLNGGENNE